MHPVHDVDVLLLLAMAVSAKRRPAELVEIIAAIDLIQGAIPSELKMVEGFARLSTSGLVCEAQGGYTLTPVAQKIMSGQPRKADTQERTFGIKEKLSTYDTQGEHAAIVLAAEQLGAAIVAHRAAGKAVARNLLLPKPKAQEADGKLPGQRQRKPRPTHRRKA
jgi:hypothetical protein